MTDVFPAFPFNAILFVVLILLGIAAGRFSRQDKERIRGTLILLTLFFALALLLEFLTVAKGNELRSNVISVLYFGIGLFSLRILGLFLFRAFLPKLNVHWPNILGDLVIVGAWLAWGMMWLREFGLDFTEIVATSAVLTAIAAFAMQDTLGNVIDGIALQSDQSVKLGDWIHLDDIEGRVVDIRWRSIKLETRNWETVVIPNGLLMRSQFRILGRRIGEPLQWRRWIWFQIDFTEDPQAVITTVEKAVRQAQIQHVSSKPAPNCLMMDFDKSVARYALRYWLTDFALDDPTDSSIRHHIYVALCRAGLTPAIPSQKLFVVQDDEKYEERNAERNIDHRLAMLSGIDLFQGLESLELERLAGLLQPTPYADGDVLAERGAVDDAFHVIVDGEVGLVLPDQEKSDLEVLTLSAGEFFGERGVLLGIPRASTAIACGSVECYKLQKTDFQEYLQIHAHLAEKIAKVMASRHIRLELAAEDIGHQKDQNKPEHHFEVLEKIRSRLGLGSLRDL